MWEDKVVSNFLTEREGQLHFFKNFGIKLDENDVLVANTRMRSMYEQVLRTDMPTKW